jgi:hypothetical protein
MKKQTKKTVFYAQIKAVRLSTPYIGYEGIKIISSGRVVRGAHVGKQLRTAVLVETEPGPA